MRKYLAVCMAALAFAAALALAGCSSGAASASSSAASGSSAEATSSASADSSAESSSVSADSADSSSVAASSTGSDLANGEYSATFETDSDMFHVNEALDGKGVLTVTDDGMTIHVSLASKRIVNVYAGTKAEAEADEANVIEPTTDVVTYDDGATKEVYGFDIPVPAIGEEFDVAILGEKGKWYDHKVSVLDPVAQ